MSYFGTRIGVMSVILWGGLWVRHPAWDQHPASDPHTEAKERARIVLAKALPTLDGTHLKATLVEVHYDPGEASPPHSHPCAVLGYVVEGAIRTHVKGVPETTYKAGESFYEAPNGVHLVSANSSSSEPAKLIAYLICDHDTPLSVDVPEGAYNKGDAK